MIVAYAAMMTVTGACGHEKNELVHDHEHEHEEGHEHGHDHEGHNHGSGPEITLEPEQAEQMGVKTETVSTGEFTDGIKVTGKIAGSPNGSGVLTAPTQGVFHFTTTLTPGSQVTKGMTVGRVDAAAVSGGDSGAAALSAMNIAKRELDRLTPLYQQKLVTADKYNAALAAYEQAKAAYSPAAVSGVVKAPLTGTITEVLVGEGQFVAPGTEIARLTDGSKLTVTFDVPARYAAQIDGIDGARIVNPLTRGSVTVSELGGRRVTSGINVSTTPGYIPVTFTFDNDSRFMPGVIVEGYLTGQSRDGVISVALTAVTEQQGNYFVYVKVDDDGYLKSPVTLGARDGKNVEILSGLHPGDEVVVDGVTALRLAETSGAVPEGHTHSH